MPDVDERNFLILGALMWVFVGVLFIEAIVYWFRSTRKAWREWRQRRREQKEEEKRSYRLARLSPKLRKIREEESDAATDEPHRQD